METVVLNANKHMKIEDYSYTSLVPLLYTNRDKVA